MSRSKCRIAAPIVYKLVLQFFCFPSRATASFTLTEDLSAIVQRVHLEDMRCMRQTGRHILLPETQNPPLLHLRRRYGNKRDNESEGLPDVRSGTSIGDSSLRFQGISMKCKKGGYPCYRKGRKNPPQTG